jgi:hypothetical protein
MGFPTRQRPQERRDGLWPTAEHRTGRAERSWGRYGRDPARWGNVRRGLRRRGRSTPLPRAVGAGGVAMTPASTRKLAEIPSDTLRPSAWLECQPPVLSMLALGVLHSAADAAVRDRDVELAGLVSSSRFARDAEGALLVTVGDPPVDAILLAPTGGQGGRIRSGTALGKLRKNRAPNCGSPRFAPKPRQGERAAVGLSGSVLSVLNEHAQRY